MIENTPTHPDVTPTEPSTPDALRHASGEHDISSRIRCPECSGGRSHPVADCGVCIGAGSVTRAVFALYCARRGQGRTS
jgi:hypothetical protein